MVWCSGKESACYARDMGLISEWGRYTEGGYGNPLQYSCLEIPWTEEPGGLQCMGFAKSRTCLSTHTQGLMNKLSGVNLWRWNCRFKI